MVDFSDDLKACMGMLRAGETILYPTDTVWGLGCDATCSQAVDKVFQLKNRPPQKSMIVLLAEARDILQYVAAPPPDIIQVIEAFERPTTLVFEGAIGLAENTIGADGSIAIRIPQDTFCKALIKRFGKPIISTSANLSSTPTAAFFEEIDQAIVTGVGYAVRYRRGDKTPHRPSRVLRMLPGGSFEVLRD
ncbi:MAG: L-threonylcarbamoyladenylate synthase [Bacteroidetes bacterium]|nr:L-threonylcarbamoyladenylate synthase [Bacteroidota bacterium]